MASNAQPTDRRGVLIVEDDEAVRRVVHRALEDEGFRVDEAVNGADALKAATSNPPDLVILDLGLPDVSGVEVLTCLRRSSGVPVLVLSGRAEEADRVAALELGADDYVVKPFFARELAARVRALLRRGSVDPIVEPLAFPDLTIDALARSVMVRGVKVELTAKEFDLLVELASHPGQVATRENLLRVVWQSSAQWQDSDTVTEHVRRVRRKIEVNFEDPQWIRTVRGVGYCFEPCGVSPPM
jgi:DNA-binding response OmpR family regulator